MIRNLFDGVLISKRFKVIAEKFQRSNCEFNAFVGMLSQKSLNAARTFSI
jgi:hypothetical protein